MQTQGARETLYEARGTDQSNCVCDKHPRRGPRQALECLPFHPYLWDDSLSGIMSKLP